MKILHVFTVATTPQSFFDGQFAYLSKLGYEIHFATGDIANDDFCLHNNVTHHQINVARKIDIKSDIKAIFQLIRLIKKEGFEIVVGHTPKGALVSMIAAWLSGVNIRIYYRHGIIYTTAKGIKRRLFKTIEQVTSILATQIINVSPSLSSLAVKDHLNHDRKQIVIGKGTCGGIDAVTLFNPDLIDMEERENLRKKFWGETDLVIGFCGRLCRDKGIEELVDGFNLFQAKHPGIKSKLLLIGPYDVRDILSDKTRTEIQHNKNIVTTGRQDKSKLPLLYSLMDVFVFPSYREGFGMSVIEASAMKVPVLVSRSHGCIDSIKENITGKYIEISSNGISEGLEMILDSKYRRELGSNGRQIVLKNFDHSVMWPLIGEFYLNLTEVSNIYE